MSSVVRHRKPPQTVVEIDKVVEFSLPEHDATHISSTPSNSVVYTIKITGFHHRKEKENLLVLIDSSAKVFTLKITSTNGQRNEVTKSATQFNTLLEKLRTEAGLSMLKCKPLSSKCEPEEVYSRLEAIAEALSSLASESDIQPSQCQQVSNTLSTFPFKRRSSSPYKARESGTLSALSGLVGVSSSIDDNCMIIKSKELIETFLNTDEVLIENPLHRDLVEDFMILQKNSDRKTQKERWVVLRHRLVVTYKSSSLQKQCEVFPLDDFEFSKITQDSQVGFSISRIRPNPRGRSGTNSAGNSSSSQLGLVPTNPNPNSNLLSRENNNPSSSSLSSNSNSNSSPSFELFFKTPPPPPILERWQKALQLVKEDFKKANTPISGFVTVEVVAGRNLVSMDINGYSDPYVTLVAEQQQYRTSVVYKTLNPRWENPPSFRFDLTQGRTWLHCVVWDMDLVSGLGLGIAHDFMGQTVVPISLFDLKSHNEGWFSLYRRKTGEKVTGQLYLRIDCHLTKRAKGDNANLVFGVDLKEVLSRKGNEGLNCPAAILKLIQHIQTEGVPTQGIFRLSPTHQNLDDLKKLINQGQDFDVANLESVHISACGLKMYLRELPEPLPTFDSYERINKILDNANDETLIEELKKTLALIPASSRGLMIIVLELLEKVAEQSATNLMTVDNLSIVFCPLLWRPAEDTMASVLRLPKFNTATSVLLKNYKTIFSIVAQPTNAESKEV